MLHIVMDGAGDAPPGWLDEYQIAMVPIKIAFGDRTYVQGEDLDNEGFYRLVDESGKIPKTSQPSPQAFIDFYRKIAQAGDTILSIHVTGRLSGTLASAEAAARDLMNEMRIITLDSLSGSAAMGLMCREARLQERAGATLEQILERMEQIRHGMTIILTLNTLDYAVKGGRVKALQAAVASLLNVKPIVVLEEGLLNMTERVRTRGRALQYVLDSVYKRVGDRKINAAVVHARDPQAGEALMAQVRERFNLNELIMTELAIPVAANLGPGTVGLVAYPV